MVIGIAETVRIEAVVADQLEDYCNETGKRKKYVVTQAVQEWLDKETGGEK